ncbi:MAG: tRNA lysidine(34) synthetase TilS [Lacibacter sp.]
MTEQFKKCIAANKLFEQQDHLLLAVSGGVDSVVLVDLCFKAGYSFSIAHCNFQLRGEESYRDEVFVKELAKKYNAELHVKTFDTVALSKQYKTSIEETARNLRYAWFEELLKTNDYRLSAILTAHHADDNIETMLMNFFRGTGMKGLRGMLPKNGNIVRPLLFVQRKDIEAYAQENNLAFVTDSTNASTEYTRNFFRHKIIPLLKEIYPEAEQNLLSNQQRFAEAELLYQQSIQQHKKKLLECKGNEIHIPVLKLKKTEPLKTIVFEIISEFGFTAAQTNDVVDLLDAENSKYVQSATHRIIKNRSWLIIAPLQNEESSFVLIEENDHQVSMASFQLQLSIANKPDAEIYTANTIALLDASTIAFPLLLRKWKTGDYFYPLGMKKKKKLARFFIDQKLSRTEKENVWVLESNKKIIWVVGHRIDDRAKVLPTTKSILTIRVISSS